MSKYRIKVRAFMRGSRLLECYEVQMKILGLFWVEKDYFWSEEEARSYLSGLRERDSYQVRYIE